MKRYNLLKRIPNVNGSHYLFEHDFESVSEAVAFARRTFVKGDELQIQDTRNNEILKQWKLRK